MATETQDNPPNATVYIRNIDEKIKIPALIDELRDVFGTFGNIVDIVAKKNLKARGQAFVVYDAVESAKDAIEELQDFDLFEKPMKLAFAKTRSDATVMREEGEQGLEQHKRHRIAEKERKQALEAANNQKATKRAAAESLAERPAKTTKAPGGAGGAADEFLPPNKIVFVRDLPEEYDQEKITSIFSQYMGFKEVRIPPGRKGIAFVEYEDESGAIGAKEATGGTKMDGRTVRVTFVRK